MFDKKSGSKITYGIVGLGRFGQALARDLAESGAENIVCTQPFGCLPNHICGKGMMKPIKDRNPNVNIVAIDYDAGATRVNQENRLKLMLANARRIQQEKREAQQSASA